ncbi:antA/AntB antirepressor family protein [Secundilactobacillus paracollinoides]|uniref:Toxin Bro n=1 Tax=Secundilactobacillus paracollinoides TaxID=240427 RepID=A0A1B2J2M2_9LACO|nr:antA/AntB antirepressor family protein [Secundilactobacillus paracollinoides]ANZ62546.1 toxin Bro [Secundilactobacillus paracollinoides]ANZ68542.1 toxin Bro [Secundilactobacillus paracollinoides]
MNELIKTFKQSNGSIAVDGRDLHNFLEVKERYNDWFKDMQKYGFTENVDFISFTGKRVKPQGGRPQVNHALTLDMAKELSMIQRTKKGKQARQYFISMEKQAQLPQSPAERLQLVMQVTNDQTQRIEKIDSRVTDLEDNQFLAPGEYNYLSKAISKTINNFINAQQTGLNMKQRRELYKDINGGVKKITGIQTRSQLREGDFQNVQDYVSNWVPSTATLALIKQLA